MHQFWRHAIRTFYKCALRQRNNLEILFQGWMTKFQIFYKRERFQSRQMRNVKKVTLPTGSFCKTFTSVLAMEIPVPVG